MAEPGRHALADLLAFFADDDGETSDELRLKPRTTRFRGGPAGRRRVE